MRELALFAGAGGGILGGVLLGWRTVCAVEINAYCARRLMQRQNEGHLPPFPIWDDVCAFDGRPWRGSVDVVSGGFPCQDISTANSNGAGIDGEKSGLWREFARIVREVRPKYVFVENSPNLTTRGLGRVLADLAEVGADGRWGVLSAEAFGAWHLRERLWIVADLDRERELQPQGCEQEIRRWVGDGRIEAQERGDRARATWWDAEPGLVRVVHGVANRMDRIRALGNGQVPAVVAGAWETLRR
jgi:DNA (cytosine-5)-methyltransferase 1